LDGACRGVHAGELGALPHQQGVAHGAEDAWLSQRERIAWALQCPQPAPIDGIEGVHRTIHRHHKNPFAGHQRRGDDAGGHPFAPGLALAVKSDDFIASRHDTQEAPSLPKPAEMGLPTLEHRPHRYRPPARPHHLRPWQQNLPSRTVGMSTDSRVDEKPRMDGFSRMFQTARPAILGV
jgi:hypothetical protein